MLEYQVRQLVKNLFGYLHKDNSTFKLLKFLLILLNKLRKCKDILYKKF